MTVAAPAPLSAAKVLEAPLADRPDAEAVVARSGRLTYRQLDELATRCAGALLALGLAPGDRLAVSLPNDLALVAAFHGAMRLGAVWVGVNRQLAAPEKQYLLDDAGASLVLADPETAEQLAAAGAAAGRRLVVVGAGDGDEWSGLLEAVDPAATAATVAGVQVDPLAPAAIAYTSGTTGRPKGAVHSQHNLVLPGAVLVATRGYGPSLRKADCFPLTILNLQVLSTLLVAQAGGTAVVMDRVDAAGIAEWIERERATVFNGAPAMLYSLAEHPEVRPEALASLDDVWSGGSPCPEPTRRMFTAKFGLHVHTTYGLTEAPSMVAILAPGDRRNDTSGRPLAHLEVTIADADGRPARHGDEGEVVIGPAKEGPWAGAWRPMLGYRGNEAASAQAVGDGRLHTGDLGHLDADGYLHLTDRRSSLILRGGANVYPAEVERVLDEHPAVAASCVVGIADPRLGERVVAMVEPATGAAVDADELRRHCETNLARYKVPERVVPGVLPRNSMGKVVRPEVRRRLEGEAVRE
ncbi:MAG: class I adenylate-forming enzyme family protein [Acidimicrobiales bacterium]